MKNDRKKKAAKVNISGLAVFGISDDFGLGDQDRVMKNYKRSKAVADEKQAGELHMFFSPNRVPRGLTKKEVQLCISLRRSRQIEHKINQILLGDVLAAGRPIALPLEFSSPTALAKRITRKEFAAGIVAYKAQVLALIDNFKAVMAKRLDERIKDFCPKAE
jgi:hypothetical protein